VSSADPARRRYGPAPLDPADKRGHCVSVRLNIAELARLDAQRGPHQRGEWLRMAALDKLPPAPPPPINRDAWAQLARSASNLNQLAHHLNSTGLIADAADAQRIRAVLDDFRRALIGASPPTDDAGGDDEGED
jgi:hypothetical protein